MINDCVLKLGYSNLFLANGLLKNLKLPVEMFNLRTFVIALMIALRTV